MRNLKEKIKEIDAEFEDDIVKKRQDFIAFRTKEFKAIKEIEKSLKVSKSRAIAISCRYLSEILKEDKQKGETKKDE